MKRLVATLALVLLLAGCAVSPSPTVPPESALQRFYSQKVTWKACSPKGMTCAKILAPIDWANPDGATFRIAAMRHATQSPKRIGSLFVNPGGPGGSGVDTVRYVLDESFSPTLLEHFDIVGWDPRGVGRTSPLRCVSRQKMDELMYRSPESSGTPADRAAALRADVKAFVAACVKNSGEMLAHVDTESNMRDLDLMRALVGDKKLNYFGTSYGAFFGTYYAKLFPKKVGRLVLDAPVDPSQPPVSSADNQALSIETAYRAFLADCVTGPDCPFTGSVDDALRQTRQLIEEALDRTLTSDDGRPLSMGVIRNAIVYPLYERRAWPALKVMLNQLRNGSVGEAFAVSDLSIGRSLDDGTYDTLTVVNTAALCLDGRVERGTGTETPETPEAHAEAEEMPLMELLAEDPDVPLQDLACELWPYPAVLHPERITAKGAAPILVLGTTGDPATPYADAQAVAKQLESGFLVTRRGEGHGGYRFGNACIDKTVDDYLTAGIVPASDPNC